MTDQHDEGRAGNAEVYWAADEPDEVQREALRRVHGYYLDVRASGRGVVWRRAYLAYYGLELITGLQHASSRLAPGGEQGELLMTKVNEVRAIVQTILNVITRDQPSYEPRAHDASVEAKAACEIAEDVLSEFIRRTRLDEKDRRTVEWSLVLGEGYLAAEWDWTKGPLSDPQVDKTTGDYKKKPDGTLDRPPQGDVEVYSYGPHDVVHDVRSAGWDPSWVIVRNWVNRYDLAARYPGKKDALLALPTRDENERMTLSLWNFGQQWASDDVPVFTLYHRRSPALPGGRMLTFCGSDALWLFDGALPYDEIPVERVVQSDWLDRGYSYSVTFDLLGLQEAIDAAWTALVSVCDLAGIPNLITWNGSNVSIADWPGGGREVKVQPTTDAPNGGMPTLMPIPEVPEAVNLVIKLATSAVQRLSVVSSVKRGEHEEGVDSGNHAALIEVQTAEQYDPARRSNAHALERIATHALRMYAKFATAERAMVVEGGERGQRLLSFTGKKLEPISHVIATLGSPLRGTTSGRMMLGDKLMGMGKPGPDGKPMPGLTQEQWLDVVTTGRFEPVEDDLEAPRMRMQRENELLAQGFKSDAEMAQTIPVLPSDPHLEEIKFHVKVLEDFDVRRDPAKVKGVYTHIAQHEQFLAKQALGQGLPPGVGPNAPPPPMPPPGHGPPGAAPGAGPPKPGGIGDGQGGEKLPEPAKVPAAAAGEVPS